MTHKIPPIYSAPKSRYWVVFWNGNTEKPPNLASRMQNLPVAAITYIGHIPMTDNSLESRQYFWWIHRKTSISIKRTKYRGHLPVGTDQYSWEICNGTMFFLHTGPLGRLNLENTGPWLLWMLIIRATGDINVGFQLGQILFSKSFLEDLTMGANTSFQVSNLWARTQDFFWGWKSGARTFFGIWNSEASSFFDRKSPQNPAWVSSKFWTFPKSRQRVPSSPVISRFFRS